MNIVNQPEVNYFQRLRFSWKTFDLSNFENTRATQIFYKPDRERSLPPACVWLCPSCRSFSPCSVEHWAQLTAGASWLPAGPWRQLPLPSDPGHRGAAVMEQRLHIHLNVLLYYNTAYTCTSTVVPPPHTVRVATLICNDLICTIISTVYLQSNKLTGIWFILLSVLHICTIGWPYTWTGIKGGYKHSQWGRAKRTHTVVTCT